VFVSPVSVQGERIQFPQEWAAIVSKGVNGVSSEKVTMACRSCGLENQTQFAGEISIHILGLENVNKPTVWVFPRLLVCMNCGFAEFTIAENELRLLGKGPAGDVEAG
jgi:hypothetical protein